MAILFTPYYQAEDANGLPMSGALLYFYTAGTTTPVTTYQDVNGATPHANPVVASSSGLFAPIYLAAGSYKTVLKTSAGVTVQTVDNIIPGDVPAGSIVDADVASNAAIASSKLSYVPDDPDGVARSMQARLSEYVSVKDFGALGNGIADDTSAIQAAMDYAKANSVWVHVPAGDYRITASLLYDRSADPNGSLGLKMYGEGMYASILINEIAAGGPTIDLTTGASSKYQFGGRIEGIGFEQSGSGADSHGIRYRSCWHQHFESLGFFSLNGAGIQCINSAADADASAHVMIKDIYGIETIGPIFDTTNGSGGIALHTLEEINAVSCGWGTAVTFTGALSGATSGTLTANWGRATGSYLITFSDGSIKSVTLTNGSAAVSWTGAVTATASARAHRAYVVLDGAIQLSMHMCSLSGGALAPAIPLVHIKSTNVRTRQIRITDGEYGNNSGTHFKIDAVSVLHVSGIRHVRRTSEANSTIGFDFADGSSLFSGITIGQVELQIDDATPVWTWMKIGTGFEGASKPDITPPNASNFASGNVLYSFTTGAKNKPFRLGNEAGQQILTAPVKRNRVIFAAAGSVTPDLTDGEWYQAQLNGAGAYTIQPPAGGVTDGRRMLITIFKDGTASVSWDAVYEAPTVPTNGGTFMFFYDGASLTWRRVIAG